MIGIIFLLLVAYIMGSCPMGLWVGQVFFKKDIRNTGSGNIGATNAYRILGPVAGLTVFLGDFLKGAAPVIIMQSVKASQSLLPWLMVAAGMLAMLGHTFSVFLKFKGGRGVATAVGVIAILAPKILLVLLLVWLLILAVTRYVSVSSMTAAALFPILAVLWQRQNNPLIIFSLLVAILIVYKHRANIQRLVQGTELKVGR